MCVKTVFLAFQISKGNSILNTISVAVRRSPFRSDNGIYKSIINEISVAVRRSPFAVRRSPFAVQNSW